MPEEQLLGVRKMTSVVHSGIEGRFMVIEVTAARTLLTLLGFNHLVLTLTELWSAVIDTKSAASEHG